VHWQRNGSYTWTLATIWYDKGTFITELKAHSLHFLRTKFAIAMPWKDTSTMEQKVEFICEWLGGNTQYQSYADSMVCHGRRLLLLKGLNLDIMRLVFTR